MRRYLMDEIDKIAFVIWYMDTYGDTSKEEAGWALEWWKDAVSSSKDSKHDGDCMGRPYTCYRCFVEVFYNKAEMLCSVIKEIG